MNLPSSGSAPVPPPSAPRHDWPRRLANAAVTVVVLAVAAGTFVLSYDGVHAIALQGGVSVQLARIYPGLFDAVLVIACVAAITLRDARWWARGWAWLVVIVLLAAIGAADVLHAADYALRHRTTEGVVAGAPVVAVLLAFSLLLTMLRQSRPRPSATPVAGAPVDAVPVGGVPVGAVPVGAVSIVAAGAVPRPPAPPIALPPAPAEADLAEPAAVPDQVPVAPAPIADTVEIPVFTEEAGPTEPVLADSPDHAQAPAREEPALSAAVPAADTAAAAPASDTAAADPASDTASDTALLADVPATPDDPGAPDGFDAAEAPGDREAAEEPAAPDEPSTATEPAEAPVAEAPSSADTGASASADADEPLAEASPEPEQPARPTSQAIRYASSAAAAEYWESEVDPDLAGQVYPVLTSDPDIDTSGYPGDAREADDTDAPPFATAPFASVPRLNRMRVSPIPPTDDDEED